MKLNNQVATLYAAIFERSCASLFRESKRRAPHLADNFYANQLTLLQSFVMEALADDAIPFVQKMYRGKSQVRDERPTFDATPLAHRYFNATTDFIDLVQLLSAQFEFSEQVKAFKVSCEVIDLLDQPAFKFPNIHFAGETLPELAGRSAAEIFNTLVAKIRSHCRTKKFSDKIRNRQRNAEERYFTYCNYVDTLFSKTASLAIFRINLHCGDSNGLASHLLAQRAAKALDHLFANQRSNALFAHHKGYIAKLEFGRQEGAYWHVIFFFDASQRKGISSLPAQIGEYWKDVITEERGWYQPLSEKYLGKNHEATINVVDAHEASKRQGILDYLAVICKSSQFLKYKLHNRTRTLRKGHVRASTGRKKG